MATGRWVERRPVLAYWLVAVLLAMALVPVGVAVLGAYPDALGEIARRAGGELNTNLLFMVPRAVGVDGGLAVVGFLAAQPATPLVAAVIVALLLGRADVRDLASRYRFWAPSVGWRRGLGIWALAIATLVLVKLTTGWLWARSSTAGTWPDLAFGVDLASSTFWLLLLTSLFFDGGGLLEETGWRGFAFPRLQRRLTPLQSAIAVGLLWSLWHIPVKVGTLMGGVLPLLAFYLQFTVFCVLTSIVIGYFYNRLGGSTLIAIAIHGLTNDSARLSGTSGDFPGELLDLYSMVPLVPLGLVVAVLLYREGERLGLREEAIADVAPAALAPQSAAAG